MSGTLVHAGVGVAVVLLGAACSNGPQPQMQAIRVVEPGDTKLSCPDLKSNIALMDGKIAELQKATRDSTVNNAVASSASSVVVSNSYNGAYGEVFGPLQSMLASADSAQRGYDTGQLHDDLTAAKNRRDYLTDMYNKRCS